MNRNHRIWSFLKAKGFYIALALCIAGAGAAAWLTAQNTLLGIRKQQEPPVITRQEEKNQWNYNDITEQQTRGSADTPKPSQPSPPSTVPDASSTTPPADSSVSQPPADSVTSAPLCYCLPVPGSQLLAGYSNGELVKNHTLNVWRTHDGVDLAAEKGTAVTAAEAGTVAEVVMDPLWGGTVAIDHRDGTRTVYCGVAPEKALKAGDRVTAGQVLGSVDTVTAEVAMESHLHFAAKKDGKYIDPMTLPGLK